MDSNELKAGSMIRGPRLAELIHRRLFHFAAPNIWETGGVVGAPTATALTGMRMPGYKPGRVWKVTREEVDGWLESGDASEREERKGDPS